MFHFNATNTTVALDQAGRPREVRTAGERIPVTRLESIRDEIAAYPLGSGPRRVFVIEASGRRYRLVHLLRKRRWTVEELAVPVASHLAEAA